MNYLSVQNTDLRISEICLGCMRISGLSGADAVALLETALEQGINFFDHADIYAGGKSEKVFAAAVAGCGVSRESMFIQTKCGIRKGYYDFSKEHILESVDGSLTRLKTDYVDALLLHRPDTLVEPEEVAEAFTMLQESGKVKYFGVSNFNPMLIELLNKYLKQKLVFNQLQFSLMHTGMINNGINMNMTRESSTDRDGSVLEYCRLKDITIQAWSPFQHGVFKGVFLDNPDYPQLNEKIAEIAKTRGVPNTTIATAWILRHPARMQVIAGTTKAARLRDICQASKVDMTRQEWYALYTAAGNTLP